MCHENKLIKWVFHSFEKYKTPIDFREAYWIKIYLTRKCWGGKMFVDLKKKTFGIKLFFFENTDTK